MGAEYQKLWARHSGCHLRECAGSWLKPPTAQCLGGMSSFHRVTCKICLLDFTCLLLPKLPLGNKISACGGEGRGREWGASLYNFYANVFQILNLNMMKLKVSNLFSHTEKGRDFPKIRETGRAPGSKQCRRKYILWMDPGRPRCPFVILSVTNEPADFNLL